MPLSQAQNRKPLHTRDIKLDAYYRDDGLWDIEGQITDRKAYAYTSDSRGEVKSGVPVHDMFIRLTLDGRMTVVDVEVSMDAFPFPMCVEVEPNFKALIGLQIGPGWMKSVRGRVGGKHGCTHVVELFGPLATVAFQAIPTYKRQLNKDKPKPPEDRPRRKPFTLGGCHTWAYDSPVVKRMYPEWYRGPDEAGSDAPDGEHEAG